MQVLQDHLENRDRLEDQDFLAILEALEHQEREVYLVKREKEATQEWELKAHGVPRDLQDPQEKAGLEARDPSDHLDNVECQVHKEISVQWDLLDHQVIAMLPHVLDMA